MKISYIVNARMPTEKAHGVHIAQMCTALFAHFMCVCAQVGMHACLEYRYE